MVYKIRTGLNQVSKSDKRYSSFDAAVKIKDAENERIRKEQKNLYHHENKHEDKKILNPKKNLKKTKLVVDITVVKFLIL